MAQAVATQTILFSKGFLDYDGSEFGFDQYSAHRPDGSFAGLVEVVEGSTETEVQRAAEVQLS